MSRRPTPLDVVTVCASCKRASCWYGTFPCDDHRSAKTVQMPRKRLQDLGLEHPDFWTEEWSAALGRRA